MPYLREEVKLWSKDICLSESMGRKTIDKRLAAVRKGLVES